MNKRKEARRIIKGPKQTQNSEKKSEFQQKWGFQQNLPQIQSCLNSGENFQLFGSEKFGKTTFIKNLLEDSQFSLFLPGQTQVGPTSFKFRVKRVNTRKPQISSEKNW